MGATDQHGEKAGTAVERVGGHGGMEGGGGMGCGVGGVGVPRRPGGAYSGDFLTHL